MILKKHATLIVAGILLLMFVVSLSVSMQESNTFDEKAIIPAAYSYVRYGDMRLNPEHPPLLKDLAGLPLLFLHLNFPLNDPLWTNGVNEQWSLGAKFLYGNGNDADTITFWARLPIILIAILLGAFIYIWTKELAGTLAGLFALTLYAFDPNILAHDHYVTTDIGIAAFLFISTYFFVHFLKQPTAKNIALAGIFLGLAQLAKFSAVLLFPLFGLLAITFALTKQQTDKDTQSAWQFRLRNVFEYCWKYVYIVIICFFLIDALYTLNTWNMPAEKVQDIARTIFSDQGAVKIAKAFIIKMSAISHLKALSEYFLGVFMVFARVTGGPPFYFLGNVYNHATPLYFPVVFLLKETIPFLFLIFFSLAYTLLRISKSFGEKTTSWKTVIALSIHNRIAQYAMLSFVTLYAYFCITANLNIGFRHLFPILPFLYVLTAKTVFDFMRRQKTSSVSQEESVHSKHPVTPRTLTTILGLFTFWIVAIPILAYPNYLSYFNEAAGGSQNGYKYVADSNYDWGQDLKRLKVWVDQYNDCINNQTSSFLQYSCSQLTANGSLPTNMPIRNIHIDYFGGAKPAYYFGNDFTGWYAGLAPESGWFAVSATFYQENLHKIKQPEENNYKWLSYYQPVARAGNSIFIFYVSPESLSQK